MKIFKSDVDVVDAHQECGLSFADFDDIREVCAARLRDLLHLLPHRSCAVLNRTLLFLCLGRRDCLHRGAHGAADVAVARRKVRKEESGVSPVIEVNQNLERRTKCSLAEVTRK